MDVVDTFTPTHIDTYKHTHTYTHTHTHTHTLHITSQPIRQSFSILISYHDGQFFLKRILFYVSNI